jgi:hypothetical protein
MFARTRRTLAAQESETLKQEGWRVHKLINGYIRFLRSRTTGDSSRVRRSFFRLRSRRGGFRRLALGPLQPFIALTLQRMKTAVFKIWRGDASGGEIP